jgi:hypothetical protein
MATATSRARPTRATSVVRATTPSTASTSPAPPSVMAKGPVVAGKKAAAPPKPLSLLAKVRAKLAQPERLMASIASVQEPPKVPASQWPRWRKILLWAVMLMPVYAIVIYIIGALYFLPAEMKGVGIAKSLPVNVIKMVGGVAVPDVNSIPDKNGVFLQASTDYTHQTIPMIDQFNDRGLQPPTNEQMTVKANQLHYVLITQLQVSLPGDYHIYRIDSHGVDVPVNIAAARVNVPGIAEMAITMPSGQTWQPGSYVLSLPQAGLDDETYYSFFTLT